MLTYLVIAVLLAGIVLSFVFIIYERNSPAATMAWILAMTFLPFLGLFIYFVFGRRRVAIRLELLKAIREQVGDIRKALDFEGSMKSVQKMGALYHKHQGLILLAYRYPGFPPTCGNRVEVLENAQQAYPTLLGSILAAKKHVHAMYYIIQPDSSGVAFRDALAERARAGVEVRLLYDDLGSKRLKPDFFRPLVEAGGQVREYRPVRFSRFRTLYANFRNHRKIVVVDGETAYTGGINIGDEYLGLDPSRGYWRDTNVMVEGPAASHLQLVFLEDWYYVTGELLSPAYVNVAEPCPGFGDVVQVVPSGPDRPREQVMQLYFTAINYAKKRLHITTPYFIPDEPVQTALVAAAMRGVDVRLLVPKRTDSIMINYASRSYYRELLAAGCRIYEYRKGFVHSKTLAADGELGIIGTANMDIRSFRLNFEVCVVCYEGEVARKLDEHFMADLADAEQVRLKTFSKRPRVDVFLENTARLTSSLL